MHKWWMVQLRLDLGYTVYCPPVMAETAAEANAKSFDEFTKIMQRFERLPDECMVAVKIAG
jgi:hypothetical protein